jgi:cytochrome b561
MTTTVPDAVPQPEIILRYNNVAAAIHWITVIVVLTQIYVGFTFHGMERGPARGEWFTWHKTLGVTILVLTLIRLAWRLAHKPPPFPPELPRWERFAAVWNHRAFYLLLIVLPLTGLMAISGGADEATTQLAGGIPFPLIPGLSEDLGEGAGELHELLVRITIALVVIHALAALKHQFVDGRRIGRAAGRMPPFKSRDDSPTRQAD